MPDRGHSDDLAGETVRRHEPPWRTPWDEESLAEDSPRFRRSRWSRLWLPVIVSGIVQVPAAAFMLTHRDLPFLVGVPGWRLVVTLVLAVLGPLALVGARRLPGPVAAIAAAGAGATLLVGGDWFQPPYIAFAFAIGSAILRGARTWAWSSVAIGWAVPILVASILGVDLTPGRIAATTVGVLIVVAIAEGVRTRRERLAAARARRTRRKETAVQAERVRIARELHDVLAHSLSQINVQAGVGLHLIDREPAKAAEALASIKEASKTALDEVRGVLGVLRAEGGDPAAPLVPEPDLARLDGLAASIASQGVEVTVVNATKDVPGPVQLALYRIVQESLTNVVRHAAAHSATVALADIGSAYRVEIVDDGVNPPADPGAGGRGLLGMRERAELLGGVLEAGPRPEGGFAVRAEIPKGEA